MYLTGVLLFGCVSWLVDLHTGWLSTTLHVQLLGCSALCCHYSYNTKYMLISQHNSSVDAFPASTLINAFVYGKKESPNSQRSLMCLLTKAHSRSMGPKWATFTWTDQTLSLSFAPVELFPWYNFVILQELCVSNCAGKFISGNQRIMQTYMDLQSQLQQARFKEVIIVNQTSRKDK